MLHPEDRELWQEIVLASYNSVGWTFMLHPPRIT